jgi:hypothetical protein
MEVVLLETRARERMAGAEMFPKTGLKWQQFWQHGRCCMICCQK